MENYKEFISFDFYSSKVPDDLFNVSILSNYYTPPEIKNNQWKFGPVEYKLNPQGFRERDLNFIGSEISHAAFGCSFTFGDYLHENQIWFNQLKQEKNFLCAVNFAQPGISIQNIRNIFISAASVFSVKTALILLPSYTRFLAADKRITDNFNMYTNLHVESDLTVDNLETIEHKIYKYIPDLTLRMWSRDAIRDINNYAKQKNVKVFFSSWHDQTYEMLTDMSVSELLPPWPRIIPIDLAADNQHPGPLTHGLWVDQIRDII